MTFKALFIAHAPDADYRRHNSVIDTGKYYLKTVIVKNQAEALKIVKETVPQEGIHAILLCPGFTHGDVAAIATAAGPEVGVTVARGDGPGNRVTQQALQASGMIP